MKNECPSLKSLFIAVYSERGAGFKIDLDITNKLMINLGIYML